MTIAPCPCGCGVMMLGGQVIDDENLASLARNLATAAALHLSRDLGAAYGYPDEPGWDWFPGCGRVAPSTTTKGGEL